MEVLKNVLAHSQPKQPEIAKNDILHHDNCRVHTSRMKSTFLAKWKIEVLPHPPYSPDLASCNYWLFPCLKRGLCGCQFASDEEAVIARTTIFKRTPVEEFSKIIKEKGAEKWNICIKHDGCYLVKEKT